MYYRSKEASRIGDAIRLAKRKARIVKHNAPGMTIEELGSEIKQTLGETVRDLRKAPGQDLRDLRSMPIRDILNKASRRKRRVELSGRVMKDKAGRVRDILRGEGDMKSKVKRARKVLSMDKDMYRLKYKLP